jgi:2-methylcitrate dehydratase PrpD
MATAAADDVTARIVDYVLSARPDDLPAAVRKEGVRSFLNVLGCTYGGAQHEATGKTWAALRPFAGPSRVSLIGRSEKADALSASLVNTLASSIATYDDTHAEAIVHPSGPIMATVLAIAEEQPVLGRDALTAFILGVEVVCRLSKAVSVPPAKGKIAWSQTGICCGVGAALAASRLLGLDAGAARQAVGHAASQASGLRVAHGTMCTAMMPAQAAQSGLRAAHFAKAGVTSSERALEGRYGFAECFAVSPHLEALTSRLGDHFEILANTYKPFPCGIVINPLIDAALQLRSAHGLKADEIARIEMVVSPGAIALCDRRHPKDEFEGQVSLYHWVASAFVRGRAGSADGTDAVIRDPAMRAFRERIFATASPAMPIDGVDMAVKLADGRTISLSLRDCIGSKGRPMTDDQLTAKFEQSAASVLSADTMRRVIADCWRLEDLADAKAVIAAG